MRRPKGELNLLLALFLIAYCFTFLVVYLYIKDPLFHEVMYGLLVFFMVALDLELTIKQRSWANDRIFVFGILM